MPRDINGGHACREFSLGTPTPVLFPQPQDSFTHLLGVGGGAPWFQCWPSRVGGRVWTAGAECYPQGRPVATLSPEEVPAAPKAGVAIGIPVSRLWASLNSQRSGGGLKVTVASGLP